MITLQERKLIIKLQKDGKKQEYIAQLIGCSQATVSKWVFKNKEGRTLETLPRSGRPTKLNAENLKNLKMKLLSEVKEANKKYCSVKTNQLSEIITKEIGIKYTNRHVERILHRLGFSLITPRSKHIKQNPEKIAEFRSEFKKNSIRNIWVIPLSPSMK